MVDVVGLDSEHGQDVLRAQICEGKLGLNEASMIWRNVKKEVIKGTSRNGIAFRDRAL